MSSVSMIQGRCAGRVAVATAAGLLMAFAGAGTAMAQCDGLWPATFGNPGATRTNGTSANIATSLLWDRDGEGPLPAQLVVGGTFNTIDGQAINNIALWDGSTWQAVGGGTNSQVLGLLPIAGPNGTTDLIAIGSFSLAGGTSVTGVARWNGTAWTRVGSALPSGMGSAQVFAIAQQQSGQLVISGRWGSSVPNVAVLNETTNSWQGIGATLNQSPNALAVTADGSLYAGGPAFTISGTNVGGVVRWTGSGWERPGSGVNGTVFALRALSDGRLAVGGTFTNFFAGIGTPGRIALWRRTGPATGWSELNTGVNGDVRSILELSDGTLIVGGAFDRAGSPQRFASRLARFNGTSWSGTGFGLENSPAPAAAIVSTLTQLPNGDVFVGGLFDSAGGSVAQSLSVWTPPSIPTFTTQPDNTSVPPCVPRSASFTYQLAEPTFGITWQIRNADTNFNWIDLVEGDNTFFGTFVLNATGTFSNTLTLDRGGANWEFTTQVRVLATNDCGTTSSRIAVLSVSGDCSCSPADIANTDGEPTPDFSIDNGDFSLFFTSFFLDETDPERFRADIADTDGLTNVNGGGPDGVVDNGDFAAFFDSFFVGCPLP